MRKFTSSRQLVVSSSVGARPIYHCSGNRDYQKNGSRLLNYGEPEYRFREENLKPTFSSKSPDHLHTLFPTYLSWSFCLSTYWIHCLSASCQLIAFSRLLRDLFTHPPHCPPKSPDKKSTSSYLNRAKSCVDSLREI